SQQQLKEIVDSLEDVSIKLKILPALRDILNGKIEFSKIRNVRPEDFLGRVQADLDISALKNMSKNKIILVTGAGGSIGSEITHQFSHFEPEMFILFEFTVYFLFDPD